MKLHFRRLALVALLGVSPLVSVVGCDDEPTGDDSLQELSASTDVASLVEVGASATVELVLELSPQPRATRQDTFLSASTITVSDPSGALDTFADTDVSVPTSGATVTSLRTTAADVQIAAQGPNPHTVTVKEKCKAAGAVTFTATATGDFDDGSAAEARWIAPTSSATMLCQEPGSG